MRNVIIDEKFTPRCFIVGKNAIDKGICECGLIEDKSQRTKKENETYGKFITRALH